MEPAKTAYRAMRVLRWALWGMFLVFCLYVQINRGTVVTSFGQLPLGVEVTIYALGVGAVVAGLLELMLRERAGIPRRP